MSVSMGVWGCLFLCVRVRGGVRVRVCVRVRVHVRVRVRVRVRVHVRVRVRVRVYKCRNAGLSGI